MIRVLNFFTIMNRGGAETMVMNYYRAIDRTKVQFDFLVHRNERGAYEDEIEAMGGKIYRMCPIYPQNFIKYKRMLKEFFDKHNEYSIIHSHMSELGYFAFIEAEKHGIPLRICHAHSSPNKKNLKMLVRNYFKKNMMSHITHMFACGEKAGKWLYGKENTEKVIVLKNAIDAKKYIYNKNIDNEVRYEFGLQNQFIVGHVGTFKEAKNHYFIIDVFREIIKFRENAVLLLVGDGELRPQIEKYVSDHCLNKKVIFAGSRSDIYRIVQCFDIFIFPSLWEGLPVSMIEAQAGGTMCFISNTMPSECCVTPNTRIISLEKAADYWAACIIKESSHLVKQSMYDRIVEAGYDIYENAKWLQEFYMSGGKSIE